MSGRELIWADTPLTSLPTSNSSVPDCMAVTDSCQEICQKIRTQYKGDNLNLIVLTLNP